MPVRNDYVPPLSFETGTSVQPRGASHQAAVRTLAIAIRYGLRVNHLRLYDITDGELTGRYLDIRIDTHNLKLQQNL